MASNYRTLRREMEVVPPETTIRGWASKSLLGGKPSRSGRPRNLTDEEEASLVKLLIDVRDGGGVLDNDTIVYMAKVMSSRSLFVICFIFFAFPTGCAGCIPR